MILSGGYEVDFSAEKESSCKCSIVHKCTHYLEIEFEVEIVFKLKV